MQNFKRSKFWDGRSIWWVLSYKSSLWKRIVKLKVSVKEMRQMEKSRVATGFNVLNLNGNFF
jgi:hypothetical protein